MSGLFNNNASVAITANGAFATITVPEPLSANQTAGQNIAPLIDEASYFIVAGSTGVATVVTFQELGGDGTWRNLASPGPITLANSGSYNGGITGQFHGLQIVVSGLVGNGIAYAELKGVVSS